MQHLNADDLLRIMNIPAPVFMEFCARFSRFEYALKECGYVRGGPYNSALPDWDRFSRENGPSICEIGEARIDEACRYLVDMPPMVQKLLNGKVVFAPENLRGNNIGEKSVEAMRRVRNNLFHGGKHTGHSMPGRDGELLKRSLLVLDACLRVSSKVRSAYEDLPV